MSLPNKTNLLPDRPGIPPMAAMPEPETIDIPALAKAYADGDIDLICVLGPTASGKTRYAVQLARVLGYAEILSADSRQVYTGMDIGTGKDLEEYGEVPYHLIDIVPAGSKYNIYEYQAAFADAWADVRARGCVPILCGGSGLYIESATRGYKFDRENGVPAERLPQKTF
jgi:tRNA dimethylallyltransferase